MSAPRGNAVLNWFLARPVLARAEAEAAHLSAEQREYVRRAKLAFEAAQLVLMPGNAVRSGSTSPLASNLFRQALYWALLSQQPASEGVAPSPAEAWAAADPALLAEIARADRVMARSGRRARSAASHPSAAASTAAAPSAMPQYPSTWCRFEAA